MWGGESFAYRSIKRGQQFFFVQSNFQECRLIYVCVPAGVRVCVLKRIFSLQNACWVNDVQEPEPCSSTGCRVIKWIVVCEFHREKCRPLPLKESLNANLASYHSFRRIFMEKLLALYFVRISRLRAHDSKKSPEIFDADFGWRPSITSSKSHQIIAKIHICFQETFPSSKELHVWVFSTIFCEFWIKFLWCSTRNNFFACQIPNSYKVFSWSWRKTYYDFQILTKNTYWLS